MNRTFQALGMSALLAGAALVSGGCAGDQYSRSTGTYIDDSALSTKIKTQLLTDKDVKGTEVKVRTYNGEVQLSGFVDTQFEKDRAIAIARAAPGVRDVRDDMVVKAPATARGPAPLQEPAGAQAPPADQR